MLIHIKMKTGDDLIGNLVNSDNDEVTIENPIQVKIHPVHGFFAKSWLLLSEANSVDLSISDIIFWGEANTRAVEYYNTFSERLTELSNLKSRVEDRQDEYEEIEDVLVAYMESKESIKH